MAKKSLASFVVTSCLCFSQSIESHPPAQDDPLRLRVNVVLVQLNVAVTDNKGNYVTGLRPEDFSITEDKISQKISTFEQSSDPDQSSREVTRKGSIKSPDDNSTPDPLTDLTVPHPSDASLFILSTQVTTCTEALYLLRMQSSTLSAPWTTRAS